MRDVRERIRRKRSAKTSRTAHQTPPLSSAKRSRVRRPLADDNLIKILTGQDEDESPVAAADEQDLHKSTPTSASSSAANGSQHNPNHQGRATGTKRVASDGSCASEVSADPSAHEQPNDNGQDATKREQSQNGERPPAVPPRPKHDFPAGSASGEKGQTRGENVGPSKFDADKGKNIQVIVLLENANLETVKVPGRTTGLALLNSEDHHHVLKKTKRDANDARPDILHQCLLTLLDSPLNKAGKLKVYVRSARNVLIEVHPQTRIPRTVRRFYGLMVELLQKYKVRGTSGSSPLLKVIRNPITSHLPVGTRKIVCTYNCDNIVDVRDHAARMANLAARPDKQVGGHASDAGGGDKNTEEDALSILYVVGAMAHGKVTEEWAEDNICISEYPLSAATVCSRITYAYECLLGIL